MRVSVNTSVRGKNGTVMVIITGTILPVSIVARGRGGIVVKAGAEKRLQRRGGVPVSTVMAGAGSVEVPFCNLTQIEFPPSNTLSGQLTMREIREEARAASDERWFQENVALYLTHTEFPPG